MLDVEQIALELVREYEARALEWKAKADGVRLLYKKLTEKAGSVAKETKQDNQPPTEA